MLFLHCEILTFILESSLSKYTSDSKRKCKYQTWALTSCPAERWDAGILHVMVEGAAWDELVVNFFKVVHFKPFHYNLSIKYPFFSAKMSKKINLQNYVFSEQFLWVNRIFKEYLGLGLNWFFPGYFLDLDPGFLLGI